MHPVPLVLPPTAPTAPPVLDEDQQRVVAHPGGPLLVLAGPGTGKTTTLVEAIVDRIENRGADPASVLALTFSRKAAEQVRDRISARLHRTTSALISATFHSFAYGLVRQYSTAEVYAQPLRLLSAAEQDVVLHELLTDAPESVAWPDGFRAAVGTRGFAREVQTVLARARERGLDGETLRRLGERHDRPELAAAGFFLDQYLDVLDSDSALDYADLISRAVVVAERHRDELRNRYRHVFVDEYQDTDPAQVALLRAIAGDGRDLVVVGDPDQSIYAFRGAEVRGILDFPREFARRDGTAAPVLALRHTRRYGERIALAASRVAATMPVTGSIDAGVLRTFRAPIADPARAGRVDVRTFDTARAETEHIGDLLRRAHLEDGIAWSQMAVLVRSGRGSIPGLRRALGGAGVPVEVAADDTPLMREPALQPLIAALRIVSTGDDDDRADELLLSPLGGLDAIELRRLSRALRRREKALAEMESRTPLSSIALLRQAVLDPTVLADDDPAVDRVRALAALLATARADLERGGTAEEVLWTLWAGTRWPTRLRRACDLGGAAGRLAHRDLDAVCALFDAAARTEARRGHTSVEAFLEALLAQELPGDTLADRGVRGEGVRLLTAHRAKGLEWDLVVVASVQEQTWPDLRRRSSLLEADRLDRDELRSPLSVSALLAEERRVFYVACTRARRRLVVTAVASPDEDGDQPSRFLQTLGVEVVPVIGRPARPLSLGGLVAELRRAVADPASSPALREAAAIRLARLADERNGERPLVPQADPGTWWGTAAPTRAPRPLRDAEAPLRLSASDLEAIDECATKWFLEREAGGTTVATSAQGVGLIVHALADRISRGDLPAVPGDQESLMELVDQVWDQMSFRTPWARGREREALRLGLVRFVDWHLAERGRRLVATEQPFVTEVDLPNGERIQLRGFADRLEVDAAGDLVVVDLKTGKAAPTAGGVREHIQLGLYQYAAAHGAFADVVGEAACGGAELVQLRASPTPTAKVQIQAPDDPGHVGIEERLTEVASMLRAETFTARSGTHCRYCEFEVLCPVNGTGTVFDR